MFSKGLLCTKSVVEVVDVYCDGLRLCRLVSTDWPALPGVSWNQLYQANLAEKWEKFWKELQTNFTG